MNNVIFYTTGCPKCKILKKKLDDKSIKYTLFTDIDKMVEKGLISVPMLEVNGRMMDFMESIEWVKGVI